MDINKKVNHEKRRCAVGLHNYQFPKGYKKDQSISLLICKRCGVIMLPSKVQSRKSYGENNGN